MLEGITVLNEVVKHVPNSNQYLFLFISIIGLIVFTFVYNHYNNNFVNLMLFIFAILSFTALGWLMFYKPINYTQYDVVIDDTVSYVEFKNAYIVVGRNGNIYTIKEKE